MDLTQTTLKTMFSYDPETGVFVRLPQENQKAYNNQWAGKRAGFTSDRGYRQIDIGGKAYYEHRLVWLYVYGHWPTKYLDHIDNNPANNALSNLRDINHQTNLARQRSQNPLGKGIQRRGSKFSARLSKSGVDYYLGVFDTPEEAQNARAAKARELWGEFAK